MKTTWEVVIGLEVHVQLATNAKLFSGASTAYGAAPNTQACGIDIALPGVLPVLNEAALTMAIRFGLAVQSTIALQSVFARKNYFYPDLPKGYQISQFDYPIVQGGHLCFSLEDGTAKTIHLTRAHLEEDAGKSLHEDFHGCSGIDLNRAGVPLLEIVSEPELRSAEEAVAYLKALHSLVRYLGICDGNMQEGSFRCDANVSVRPLGQSTLGTRAEIKNVNSFRFVEKAIRYEMARQIEILESDGTVIQETRLYDSQKDQTRSMRAKEEANDYRYFPDPDLLPVVIDKHFIEAIAQTLPELPAQKAERFRTQYGLSPYDAAVLTAEKALADFFEAALKASHPHPSPSPHSEGENQNSAKLCANWVMGELLGALNKHHLDITQSPITPLRLGQLLKRIQDQTLSGKTAKVLFEVLWQSDEDIDSLIEKHGFKQVSDASVIAAMVDTVLAAHPSQCEEYRKGNERLFGFFVGQLMKTGGGNLHPEMANHILRDKLA